MPRRTHRLLGFWAATTGRSRPEFCGESCGNSLESDQMTEQYTCARRITPNCNGPIGISSRPSPAHDVETMLSGQPRLSPEAQAAPRFQSGKGPSNGILIIRLVSDCTPTPGCKSHPLSAIAALIQTSPAEATGRLRSCP